MSGSMIRPEVWFGFRYDMQYQLIHFDDETSRQIKLLPKSPLQSPLTHITPKCSIKLQKRMHKSLPKVSLTQTVSKLLPFFQPLCQNIIINSVRVCQYFLFIITPRPRTLKESEKKRSEWNIKIIYYRTLTFITTLETQLASLMYTLCLFSPSLWRCSASFIFFVLRWWMKSKVRKKAKQIKNTSTKRGFICWNYHIPWNDVSRRRSCMNISAFVPSTLDIHPGRMRCFS